MTRLTLTRLDLLRTVIHFLRSLGLSNALASVRKRVSANENSEPPEVTMTMDRVVSRLERFVAELAELRAYCVPAAKRDPTEATMTMSRVVSRLEQLVTELAELRAYCVPAALRVPPKKLRSVSEMKRFKKQRWQENPNCEFCDRKMRLDEVTVDHKLPRCRGGDDSDENLTIACSRCNECKSAMTANEFEQVKRAGLRVPKIRRTKSGLSSFRKRKWKKNPACTYCGKALMRKEAVLDRKIPLSRGGDDHGNNLVLCCVRCQEQKAEQTFSEFENAGGVKRCELQEV